MGYSLESYPRLRYISPYEMEARWESLTVRCKTVYRYWVNDFDGLEVWIQTPIPKILDVFWFEILAVSPLGGCHSSFNPYGIKSYRYAVRDFKIYAIVAELVADFDLQIGIFEGEIPLSVLMEEDDRHE